MRAIIRAKNPATQPKLAVLMCSKPYALRLQQAHVNPAYMLSVARLLRCSRGLATGQSGTWRDTSPSGSWSSACAQHSNEGHIARLRTSVLCMPVCVALTLGILHVAQSLLPRSSATMRRAPCIWAHASYPTGTCQLHKPPQSNNHSPATQSIHCPSALTAQSSAAAAVAACCCRCCLRLRPLPSPQ